MQRQTTHSLSVRVPSKNYKLEFIAAYEDKDEIIAVAELTPLGGLELGVMASVKALLSINQTQIRSKPIRYYVLNASDYENTRSKSYTVVRSLDEISELTKNMMLIFAADNIKQQISLK